MIDVQTMMETLRNARVVDLAQPLEEHMPTFPTHSKFYHNLWGSYWHGDRSLTYQLVMNEHSGTHVDAPAHFISNANPRAHVTIEQIALTRLIGRGARLDCRRFQEGDHVPASFVTEWEAQHGGLRLAGSRGRANLSEKCRLGASPRARELVRRDAFEFIQELRSHAGLTPEGNCHC